MKFLKIKLGIFSLLAIFAVSVFFTSCEQDVIGPSTNNISKEILDKLEESYYGTDNVEKVKLNHPDGTSDDMYQVEGDIMLSEEQIMDFDIGEGLTLRQWRSKYLVKQGMEIKVLGYTRAPFALDRNARKALDRAINNFNNLGITFDLSFGEDNSDVHIVVADISRSNPGKSGGRALLPSSDGMPGRYVYIYNAGDKESVLEHLLTHELGHTIGLKHTDWINGKSCNGREPETGRFTYINGTPSGNDDKSVMNACYSNDEKAARRNFSYYDIKALEAMYPMGK